MKMATPSQLPWVVDFTVANSVALVGSCFTILMWLVPVRDVWTGSESIFMTKGERIPASSLSYVAGVFNCLLWVMYGTTRLEQMLIAWLVNVCGLLLNFSFAACYYWFSAGSFRRQIKTELAVFSVILFIAIMIWLTTGSNDGVGYIAMGVNILMYFGPLSATKKIIRARSARGFPLPPLVMQLIASVIWSAWAIYLVEIPIIIPNVLGVLFATLQIMLWIWAVRQEKIINASTAVGEVEFEAVTKVTSRRPSAEGLDGQVLDYDDSDSVIPRDSIVGI